MTHPFQVIRIMRDGSETTVHSCNSSHEASTACDLASKWEYANLILPFDKFYASDDNRRDPIEKLEEDYVYDVDLFNN